jgi:hypothetical protein
MSNPMNRTRVQVDPFTQQNISRVLEKHAPSTLSRRLGVPREDIHRAAAGELVDVESAHRMSTMYSARRL